MNRYEPKMRELEAVPMFYKGMFLLNGDFIDGRPFPLHVTEFQIQVAEEQMGGRFPDDYREFIRDFGGFSLSAAHRIEYQYRGELVVEESTIGAFYAIISDDDMNSWDIVRTYINACKHSEVWHEDWLHLGTTGGPSIAYAFKGPNIGSVYTFDIEWQLIFIARSFDEFMGLLYVREDEIYDLEEYNRIHQGPSFWDTFSTP